jgi:hypothetical protein
MIQNIQMRKAIGKISLMRSSSLIGLVSKASPLALTPDEEELVPISSEQLFLENHQEDHFAPRPKAPHGL